MEKVLAPDKCPKNYCDGSGIRTVMMRDYAGSRYEEYFICHACLEERRSGWSK